MKKDFSKFLLTAFLLVGIFSLGLLIKSTPVSALNNCQYIETLYAAGVIKPEKVAAIRASYGCTPRAAAPTVTPGDTSLKVSCAANKSAAKVFELIQWKATVTGGTAPYTYSWSGTDNLSGNASSTLKSYTSNGAKKAKLTVTDSSSTTKKASCDITLTQTIKYHGFMPVNGGLTSGQVMDSKNGMYRLVLHANGNLALYSSENVVWETKTTGKDATLLLMQSDGNLVLSGKKNAVYWASYKYGDPLGLSLQNDGNMVINNKKLDGVIWTSNTQNTAGTRVAQTPHNVNATPVENPENICIFDAIKYRNFYPDMKKYGKNDTRMLKWHWKNYGIAEGRTPCGADNESCSFVESNYLTLNPDVTGMTGLDHYKKYGLNEGRTVCKGTTAAAN